MFRIFHHVRSNQHLRFSLLSRLPSFSLFLPYLLALLEFDLEVRMPLGGVYISPNMLRIVDALSKGYRGIIF